ncbi:MAG: PAS domain S-box protein [Methylocystis sp.]|uniref:PAS domain S-box protein n=1 Tax=Methylocystis sp. TaxID=1911079 RepID=UPI003DA222CD
MMNFEGVRSWPAAARYAVAAPAVAATIALCALLGGAAAERPFIPLFFTALLLSVLVGAGPGLLAAVLGGLGGAYFFLPPIGSLAIADPNDLFRLAVYAFASCATCLGVGWASRRSRDALETAITRTQRRLREEANETLRESEERYRLLFETSRDGIVTVDLRGTIQDANPAFQEMLGFSLEELRTRTYQELTPARWHAWEDAILRERIIPFADSGEYEKEYVHRNGTVFPVSLRAWPVYDGKKDIIGFRAFVRDITERKRAEEALKAADRRKDEFLATLAHELRNPLAPIRNSVHLLKQEGALARERDRKLLAIADRQVQHLIRLVNDLLDFSRISRGKIELKRDRIDLLSVLRHAIETAQPAIQAGGHRLETSFTDDAVTVDGDPVRLAQVFTNLLDNAAKYTEQGGRITLSVERSGDEAVVSVRDSGVGIPVEMLPQIFDYFTQVDRTLGRAKGGLGVGLALVRRLLHLHGGSVEARSAGVGCGSDFIVRLPALTESASLPETPARPSRTPRRVLIIDDDADVADSFAELLADFGATTSVAYCSDSGVSALKTFRPELVLLDLGMPPPDGFETARRIRALPEGRDVALVALSGWGKAQVQARVRDAGFDGHLTKPAELAALSDLLGSLQAAPRG